MKSAGRGSRSHTCGRKVARRSAVLRGSRRRRRAAAARRSRLRRGQHIGSRGDSSETSTRDRGRIRPRASGVKRGSRNAARNRVRFDVGAQRAVRLRACRCSRAARLVWFSVTNDAPGCASQRDSSRACAGNPRVAAIAARASGSSTSPAWPGMAPPSSPYKAARASRGKPAGRFRFVEGERAIADDAVAVARGVARIA